MSRIPFRALRASLPFLVIATLAAPIARADHPTAGIGGGGVGPINTISADVLPSGMWALSLRLDVVDLDQFSDKELAHFAAEDIDTHSTKQVVVPSINVGYGVSDKLMLGLRVPWVSNKDVKEPALEMGVPGSEELGDSDGLGDVTLFGQYLLARETPETPAWALIGGVKLPTGADRNHTDEGELFETEMQPGSGSVDPLLGVAVTKHWGRHGLSADLLYALATDGSQDTNMGDVLSYNLGWAYRLGGEEPHEHADGSVHEHHHDDTTWDLVLELNGVRREEQTIDGARNPNSGGNRLFLAPGLRMNVEGGWSAFGSVGVPLFEHVNGEEHTTDARLVMGVSFAF